MYTVSVERDRYKILYLILILFYNTSANGYSFWIKTIYNYNFDQDAYIKTLFGFSILQFLPYLSTDLHSHTCNNLLTADILAVIGLALLQITFRSFDSCIKSDHR